MFYARNEQPTQSKEPQRQTTNDPQFLRQKSLTERMQDKVFVQTKLSRKLTKLQQELERGKELTPQNISDILIKIWEQRKYIHCSLVNLVQIYRQKVLELLLCASRRRDR